MTEHAPDGKIYYFAYGSNLLARRFAAPDRAPSARLLGRARLLNMRWRCNKKSIDGSAKANVVAAPGAVVWGALYELAVADQRPLRRAEGGYTGRTLWVVEDGGAVLAARVYVARAERLTTKPPYDWYMELLVAGALEQGLPASYVATLRAVAAAPDPDRGRAAEMRRWLKL